MPLTIVCLRLQRGSVIHEIKGAGTVEGDYYICVMYSICETADEKRMGFSVSHIHPHRKVVFPRTEIYAWLCSPRIGDL